VLECNKNTVNASPNRRKDLGEYSRLERLVEPVTDPRQGEHGKERLHHCGRHASPPDGAAVPAGHHGSVTDVDDDERELRWEVRRRITGEDMTSFTSHTHRMHKGQDN
jgi:hypothetical protein